MTCDQLLHLYFTRETSRHFSTPASSECQLSPFLNSIATALLQFYNSGNYFQIFFSGSFQIMPGRRFKMIGDYKTTTIILSLKLTRSP